MISQWGRLREAIGSDRENEHDMREIMWMKDVAMIGSMIMAVIMLNSCGTRPTPPPATPPPMQHVVFTWTAGECQDSFKLYEVTVTGKRPVAMTTTTTTTVVMHPRKSQWQVSGHCGAEEHFSEVTTFQP